ncbi:MAG TPA: hypothetical protein PKO23_00675 [Candidatus Hydrogenedentes bacterium]|nr:hypothetical protein [Candidatus Hydrogenedentota bacterium]
MIDMRHISERAVSDSLSASERVQAEAASGRHPWWHIPRQALGIIFIGLVAASALLWSHTPVHHLVPVSVFLAVGLVLFIPGAWLAVKGLPAGKALLGGGVVLLFFSVVDLVFNTAPEAGFWASLAHRLGGVPLCTGVLVLFGLVAYWASSTSASLLVCLLGLYLLHSVSPSLNTAGHTVYLIIVSVLLLLWTGLWLSRKGTLFFPYAALIALYGALAFFGGEGGSPNALSLSPVILTLLFVYVVLNLLIMHASLERETAMRGGAFLNGAGFGLTLWHLTAMAQAGLFWLAPVVLLVAGLGAARVTRRYNTLKALSDFYLCQAFWALLLLCLWSLPSGVALITASGLCFLPALYEVCRGGGVYRFTEYGFILSVFTVPFLTTMPSRSVAVGLAVIPLFSVYILAAAAVLLLLARSHDGWARASENLRPANPVGFACEQELCGAACLFGTALWIMLLTILRRNDTESLPLFLALQGVAFLGLGLVFLRPGLALAGLVPVMAGHACYYTSAQWMPSVAVLPPEIRLRTMGVLLSATCALALLWDWHLGRRAKGFPLPMERVLALLAYLPLFLAPLPAGLLRDLPYVYLAPLLAGAGLIGILIPRVSRFFLPGLQTLGGLMVAVSFPVYLYGLRSGTVPVHTCIGFLPFLGMYLIVLIILERTGGKRAFGISLVLCLGIAVWGALGLYHWNSGPVFAASLAALALLTALVGLACNARAYYHTALLLGVLAILWLLLSAIIQVYGDKTVSLPEMSSVALVGPRG